MLKLWVWIQNKQRWHEYETVDLNEEDDNDPSIERNEQDDDVIYYVHICCQWYLFSSPSLNLFVLKSFGFFLSSWYILSSFLFWLMFIE